MITNKESGRWINLSRFINLDIYWLALCSLISFQKDITWVISLTTSHSAHLPDGLTSCWRPIKNNHSCQYQILLKPILSSEICFKIECVNSPDFPKWKLPITYLQLSIIMDLTSVLDVNFWARTELIYFLQTSMSGETLTSQYHASIFRMLSLNFSCFNNLLGIVSRLLLQNRIAPTTPTTNQHKKFKPKNKTEM